MVFPCQTEMDGFSLVFFDLLHAFVAEAHTESVQSKDGQKNQDYGDRYFEQADVDATENRNREKEQQDMANQAFHGRSFDDGFLYEFTFEILNILG